MNPRLTVAVPTYNRSGDLRTALDSLLLQSGLETLSLEAIEILISDNASTDDTQDVVNEWKRKCPWPCSVYRNEVNVGFSGNLQLIFERAAGEYVLLLSDDDSLVDKAIATVLESLDSEPGLLVLNAKVMDSSLTKVLGEKLYSGFDRVGTRPMTGTEAVYDAIGWLCFPLVTGHVFHRSAWLECPPADGMKSICVHIYRTFRILAKKSLLVIDTPLVNYRTDNAAGRWNKNKAYPFVFHFDVLEAWKLAEDLVPFQVYKRFTRQFRKSVLSTLRVEKLSGRRIHRLTIARLLIEVYDFRVVSPLRELTVLFSPRLLYSVVVSTSEYLKKNIGRPIKLSARRLFKGRNK